MGGIGSGRGSGGWRGGGRPRKKKMIEKIRQEKEEKRQSPDAVTWLKKHPEDIPMAMENLAVRSSGYADDDIRRLFAAVCLRACVDYKRATQGKMCDTMPPEKVIEDCHDFFQGEMFQFFVNRIPVDEIERMIKATPEDAIINIWNRHQDNQKPVVVD